ncbi:MAG: GNAT family N-acetyltransferase [Chloroflexaceae bacterium]|jgi:ribosomal protein S18 acetylase RimI-like enzyme|nr:GNAT family N-acetyltransferase [Chloroflexaceae bacterium]
MATYSFVDNQGRRYHVTVPPGQAQPALLSLLHNQLQVGYVELDWGGDGVIENFGILVDQAYRGHEVGTGLLREALALLRDHGVKLVQGYVREGDLTLQPFLLDWYRRHGFAVLPDPRVLVAARLEKRL